MTIRNPEAVTPELVKPLADCLQGKTKRDFAAALLDCSDDIALIMLAYTGEERVADFVPDGDSEPLATLIAELLQHEIEMNPAVLATVLSKIAMDAAYTTKGKI